MAELPRQAGPTPPVRLTCLPFGVHSFESCWVIVMRVCLSVYHFLHQVWRTHTQYLQLETRLPVTTFKCKIQMQMQTSTLMLSSHTDNASSLYLGDVDEVSCRKRRRMGNPGNGMPYERHHRKRGADCLSPFPSSPAPGAAPGMAPAMLRKRRPSANLGWA